MQVSLSVANQGDVVVCVRFIPKTAVNGSCHHVRQLNQTAFRRVQKVHPSDVPLFQVDLLLKIGVNLFSKFAVPALIDKNAGLFQMASRVQEDQLSDVFVERFFDLEPFPTKPLFSD